MTKCKQNCTLSRLVSK